MSPELIGGLSMLVMLGLLALRIPVAFAMFAVGFVGLSILQNVNSAMSVMSSEAFTYASSSELVVIPLFILMGNVATVTGMSRRLYDAAYAIIGSYRGGLASATVIGCGGFAALSGSSVASALTMGKVALGEMDRFNYDKRLSTGVVAAGGTLGILIPPSMGFVIYAILTDQSIGRLFLAGVLPGILLAGMFVLTVMLLCTIWPELGPAGPKTTIAEKFKAFAGAVPIVGVTLVTIGGIYGGFFSPVEAAAVGAGLVILVGLVSRQLDLKGLWMASRETVITSSAVMLIVMSASVINPFLAISQLPEVVSTALVSLPLPPLGIIALMLLTYVVLGCFLDSLAMLVLTLPIFFPVVINLGFDPIWFGVLVVLTLEMGLISPPVGMNVFIVKSVAKNVPLGTIFAGVMPFFLTMVVTLVILVLVPQISLIVPNTMIN